MATPRSRELPDLNKYSQQVANNNLVSSEFVDEVFENIECTPGCEQRSDWPEIQRLADYIYSSSIAFGVDSDFEPEPLPEKIPPKAPVENQGSRGLKRLLDALRRSTQQPNE